MRGLKSILAVSGLASVVWAAGMTSTAESARVRGIATNDAVVPTSASVVETDVERRERLNARLADMVRSGKGSRLSEGTVRPRATRSVNRENRAERPRAVRPASIAVPEPVAMTVARAPANAAPANAAFARTADREDYSTIAPPPMRAPARRAGRGYVAPRLDLTTPPTVPTSDVECLTQAIYYEARNESEEGQAAVAEVIVNRSRAGNYPRKICEVVYQRNRRTCQFTFTCDGSIGRGTVNRSAWAKAERIARSVHEGRSQTLLPRESVNYHANYVRPSWGRRLARVKQIGAHIFYGAALNGTTPGSSAPRGDETPRGGLQFVRIEALDRAYQAALANAATPQALPPVEAAN